MATDVVMPQMGESIAEGTIVRWIKKVGDTVERDEPLFEISTDKVDAEIPSPAAGVVTEIRAKEGETVPVNSVVAVIGAGRRAGRSRRSAAGGAAGSRRAADAAAATARRPPAPAPTGASSRRADRRSAGARAQRAGRAAAERRRRAAARPPSDRARRSASARRRSCARSRRSTTSTSRRSTAPASPGRVTKDDILAFIGRASDAARPAADGAARRRRRQRAARRVRRAGAAGAAGRRGLRRPGRADVGRCARRSPSTWSLSRRTSAHVHSVFEVNFSRVAKIREAKKAEYERAGAKLTYLSFIVKAAVDALRAVPVVNASVDGDNIVYHKDVNIGIAVALDWGLIVPVDQERRREEPARPEPRRRRPREPRAQQAAQAGRSVRRHVHDHQPRRVRRAVRHADHQPAAGGDPRRRQHREAAGRDRRCDRDPADGVPDARLRPPDHRRRRRRRVHVARQAARSRTGTRREA